MATKNIQSSLLVVTGNTGIFPEISRFEEGYPGGEEGNRRYEEKVLRWNIAKRNWLSQRVKDVIARIASPCTSKTTDIFSIFSGIMQVQRNGGPWDRVVVVIFSDMINTCRPVNMIKDIDIHNAMVKGKQVCNRLIQNGQISGSGNGNLYLTIYTPDQMERTEVVYQFWRGFFEQWGLRPNQYHFE